MPDRFQVSALPGPDIHPTIAAELALGGEIDWEPDHLVESAWQQHVPFAFWVVKVLRPRVLVELGTHRGLSYFAFCQAMERFGVGGSCFAVDSWEGDPHAGFYDESIYAEVAAANRRYAGFSTLLRSRFDQALPHFADGEIDLLHIDGLHTYEAVREDFRMWRPRLSDRGVVLFHDINVRRDDFGVRQLWHELSGAHPAFAFQHGHGLGVLGIGAELPPPLQALFAAARSPERQAAIRALFAARGIAVQTRHELAAARAEIAAAQGAIAGLEQRRQAAEAAAAALREADDALAGEIAGLAAAAAAEAKEATRLRGVLALRESELAGLQASQRRVEAERDEARAAAERHGAAFAAIRASTSWRVTRPLRALVRVARGEPAAIAAIRARLGLRPPAPPQQEAAPGGWPVLAYRRLPNPAPAPREAAVDIVVCVHNAPEDVRRCLESVLASTLPPYRLILVDDGSAEETRRLLALFAESHGATLIRHDQALGYTRAANAGLRRAEAPWVVLLNSDTIVCPGWLDRMVELGATDSRIGLIGPLSNTASWQSVPTIDLQGEWPDNPLPEGMDVAAMGRLVAAAAARQGMELPFLNGFCLMARRELLQQIGLFDEDTFGAGYGEENDYCIRSRKAGWRLVVAEDVYVHHAQSRSYSHERRRALVQRADQALLAKHGTAHIHPQVAFCKETLGLAGVRARVAAMVERQRLRAAARARWEGRRIAVILPAGGEGGGGNVVLQEATALQRMGVDVWLVNLARCRPGFDAAYPALDIPTLYAGEEAEIAALLKDPARGFDAAVATLYSSVFWLPERPGTLRLGYYVQDYEPRFFPPGSEEHTRALRSYAARPDLRMFTKSAWNAREVARLAGAAPAVIGPSVDLDQFRPPPDVAADVARPVRIAAMVRPATPRRAAGLTVEILKTLHARYGDRVSLTIFGADDAELQAHGLACPELRNVGRLLRGQVSALLETADVFLDVSEYQAMGLTALEAMASGCAVLVPQAGGAVEFGRDGETALVADTADPAACEAAACRLVEDAALRARLRLNAIQEAARHTPEKAAFGMLETLFG